MPKLLETNDDVSQKSRDKQPVEEIGYSVGGYVELLFLFRGRIGNETFAVEPESFVMNWLRVILTLVQRYMDLYYKEIREVERHKRYKT